MSDPLDLVASTTDPDGRFVVVPGRLWHGKILRDHPEMAPHLDAVVAASTRRTTWPTIRATLACVTTAGTWDRAAGCSRS